MEYQVMENRQSGEYFYIEHEDGSDYPREEGFFTEFTVVFSKEEAEETLEFLKGKIVHAIFCNRTSGEVVVSEVREKEGTWKTGKKFQDHTNRWFKFELVYQNAQHKEAEEFASYYKRSIIGE